jgi:hypothetical protein
MSKPGAVVLLSPGKRRSGSGGRTSGELTYLRHYVSRAGHTFTASSVGYCLPYGDDGCWLATYLWAKPALTSPSCRTASASVLMQISFGTEQVGVHRGSGICPTYRRPSYPCPTPRRQVRQRSHCVIQPSRLESKVLIDGWDTLLSWHHGDHNLNLIKLLRLV